MPIVGGGAKTIAWHNHTNNLTRAESTQWLVTQCALCGTVLIFQTTARVTVTWALLARV